MFWGHFIPRGSIITQAVSLRATSPQYPCGGYIFFLFVAFCFCPTGTINNIEQYAHKYTKTKKTLFIKVLQEDPRPCNCFLGDYLPCGPRNLLFILCAAALVKLVFLGDVCRNKNGQHKVQNHWKFTVVIVFKRFGPTIEAGALMGTVVVRRTLLPQAGLRMLPQGGHCQHFCPSPARSEQRAFASGLAGPPFYALHRNALAWLQSGTWNVPPLPFAEWYSAQSSTKRRSIFSQYWLHWLGGNLA